MRQIGARPIYRQCALLSAAAEQVTGNLDAAGADALGDNP
jgi:hypothetical protein